MKTLRLFALLDRLRCATAPIAAEDLAAGFEVSPRTIYRDMATLQAMGAPIRGESGIGYQLEKGYFLPPLHFDPDEMEAVMLGMRLVAARGDSGLSTAAARVSGKIGAAMGAEAGATWRTLPFRAVSRRTQEGDKAAQVLSMLRLAIRDRMLLALDYLDLEQRRSHRVVRPLGLTLFDAVWLLTAWCEARAAFRNFRLDRLSGVSATGQRFRHEKGRRFQDYLDTL